MWPEPFTGQPLPGTVRSSAQGYGVPAASGQVLLALCKEKSHHPFFATLTQLLGTANLPHFLTVWLGPKGSSEVLHKVTVVVLSAKIDLE